MSLKSKLFSLLAAGFLAGCMHTGLTGGGGEGVFTGSFYDLMAQDKPVQCTWSVSTEQGDLSGKSYVAGDRVSSESTMNVEDQGDLTFNSIIDQEYLYSWSSLSDSGMKIKKVPPEGEEVEDANPELPGPQELNQEIEFDCSSWSVDESVFTPPEEIEFEELIPAPPVEIDNSITPPDVDSAIPCKICEELPEGEARDQCLANCG